jgi:hypothetical protein
MFSMASLDMQGRPEEMLETYARAARALPYEAAAHYCLATALQSRGRID